MSALARRQLRLHRRRHWLLRERWLGRPGWAPAEYAAIVDELDTLETFEMGAGYWRRQLIWRLRRRHFDLLIEHARELLARCRTTT